MENWEYKVVILQTGVIKQGKAVQEHEKLLSELGEEGWELVAVVPMHVSLGFSGSTPQVRAFLKRKI